MNVFERLYFEQPGGMFREFKGLTTHFAPKSLDLYQKLLPAPFTIPGLPVVTIFVVDYLHVVRWPITHYRYQEWTVLLKSEWNGVTGWYPVTMPVTRWFAKASGRYLGFPKYITDEVSLTRHGKTRQAQAIYKGVVQLALEYHSGITRPLNDWEEQMLGNSSFFKGEAFVLVPPGRGPRAREIILRHVIQPQWCPENGMLRVKADPGEIWAGLVPDDGEFPGSYNYFIGGINLVAVKTPQ